MSLPTMTFATTTERADHALDRVGRRAVHDVQEAMWPVAEAVAAKANAAYHGRAAAFKVRKALGPGAPIVVAAPWNPTGFLDQGTLDSKIGGARRKRAPRVRGRNYTGRGIQPEEGLRHAATGALDAAAQAARSAILSAARAEGLVVH